MIINIKSKIIYKNPLSFTLFTGLTPKATVGFELNNHQGFIMSTHIYPNLNLKDPHFKAFKISDDFIPQTQIHTFNSELFERS